MWIPSWAFCLIKKHYYKHTQYYLLAGNSFPKVFVTRGIKNKLYKRKTAVVPDHGVMVDLEGPLSHFSISLIGEVHYSHRRKNTAWHLIYMVWLNRSLSQWVGGGILLDPPPLPLRRQLTKSYGSIPIISLLVFVFYAVGIELLCLYCREGGGRGDSNGSKTAS